MAGANRDLPGAVGVIGLQAVQWQALTADGEDWLGGGAAGRGRVLVHKSPWHLRRPRPLPDLVALGLERSEALGAGSERRGVFRRRITLLRPGSSRLPLDRLWPRLGGTRHAVIADFARLVRAFHDAGVDSRSWRTALSLHPQRRRFCLRDPRQLVVGGKPLGKRARVDALARLFAAFWGLTSTTQNLRFLRAYAGGKRLCREEIIAIGRRGLRLLQWQWRRGMWASLRDNADFFRLQRGAFRIHGRNSTAAWTALAPLLPDPDACWPKARLYKLGSRTHAGSLDFAGQSCFLKRFNDRGWWYRLRNLGRESRAVRTWRTSWHCLASGVPVPPPLLCLEERRFGLLRRSYLLTAHIGHDARLQELWPKLSAREKRHLLAALGSLVGKLHAAGWVHGDLKWDNLLVPATGGKPTVIDWDGSFRPYRGFWRLETGKDLRRFLADLERFGGTAADRAFFLSWWRRWAAIA